MGGRRGKGQARGPAPTVNLNLGRGAPLWAPGRPGPSWEKGLRGEGAVHQFSHHPIYNPPSKW